MGAKDKRKTAGDGSGKQAGIISMAVYMVVGMICGMVIVHVAESRFGENASWGDFLLLMVSGIFLLYLAALIQIILHEAGHLLFGLLTGYEFSSFRIGSFMWLKDNEKLRFCRMSLAGTGGQCLMIPPQMKDGTMPYVLYNLGGPLVNLLMGAVCGLVFIRFGDVPYLSVFLAAMFLVGLAFAAMNGIPMRMGNVDNDGYNALSLGKDRKALRSFWIQMKVNEQLSKGVRLKDMPDEWFEIPSEEAMKNGMTAAVGVFACNRLMDAMELEKAEESMKKLLSMDIGMAGLHRSMLQLDCIYCELVNEKCPEHPEQMLDKELKKFMKSMKKFPSILRTRYAYALLAEHDFEKAEQIRETFEKNAKSYPYPGEIEGELALMEKARERYSSGRSAC